MHDDSHVQARGEVEEALAEEVELVEPGAHVDLPAVVAGLPDLLVGVVDGEGEGQALEDDADEVAEGHEVLEAQAPDLHRRRDAARLAEEDTEGDDDEEARVPVEEGRHGHDLARLLVDPAVLLELRELPLGQRPVVAELDRVAAAAELAALVVVPEILLHVVGRAEGRPVLDREAVGLARPRRPEALARPRPDRGVEVAVLGVHAAAVDPPDAVLDELEAAHGLGVPEDVAGAVLVGRGDGLAVVPRRVGEDGLDEAALEPVPEVLDALDVHVRLVGRGALGPQEPRLRRRLEGEGVLVAPPQTQRHAVAHEEGQVLEEPPHRDAPDAFHEQPLEQDLDAHPLRVLPLPG